MCIKKGIVLKYVKVFHEANHKITLSFSYAGLINEAEKITSDSLSIYDNKESDSHQITRNSQFMETIRVAG